MKGFLLMSLLLLCSFTPVIVPNGKTLEWEMDGDVKVFHLTAEPVQQEFAPGFNVNCWGYNGMSPGPMIEAVEGDRVRIIFTNNLPESTTVHWHGIILPNGMDGVMGLTQPGVKPGETFEYEFTLQQSGTFMYHPHADEVIQMGMGLSGFFIIHPKVDDESVDRDYAILMHEWFIPIGGKTVNPTVMTDFNYFTFNGKVWPGTESLIAKKGDKVRIRLGNLSMNNHPIHLHGYEFTVTRRGAKKLAKSAQYEEVTVDVPVGTTRDIEFLANNLGDWAFHCHKSHHLMNGMGHSPVNMIGMRITKQLQERIAKHLPNIMIMGADGMGDMYHHHMELPDNYLPLGGPGQFGIIDMGGMFTIVKVREEIDENTKNSWYKQPPSTSAHPINKNQ